MPRFSLPICFPQVVSQVLKNPLMLRKIVSTPVELLEPLSPGPNEAVGRASLVVEPKVEGGKALDDFRGFFVGNDRKSQR